MNSYPALRSRMGTWDYYMLKMSAHDLKQNVKYASEVHQDNELSEVIQRILNTSRVKKEIVEYLKHQEDRFFSSIVVAVLGGNPKFKPIKFPANLSFLNDVLGVLMFDGEEEYYALDGQHRLSAIRTLLATPDSDLPEGFEDDGFPVIVIVPNKEDPRESFMQKYRKLFTSLNRYAKPTDGATNIIMDEDDTFAILTRRLINENPFFHRTGRQRKSNRIKAKGSKSLKATKVEVEKGKDRKLTGDQYFTSIGTLYEMNIALLSSSERRTRGWGPDIEEDKKGPKLKDFIRFRPSSEEYIDDLYDELSMYWEALLTELPVLHSDPIKMRVHDPVDWDKWDGVTDHLLFWPIGQQMLAEIARALLDQRLPDSEPPTPETVKFALKGLSELEWKLHSPLWRHFLLISSLFQHRSSSKSRSSSVVWIMRNEDRAKVVRCGSKIQQWILGLPDKDGDSPDELKKQADELKKQWANFLIPRSSEERVEKLWQQFEKRRQAVEERRQEEEKRRQREALEALEEALETFSRTVSDDDHDEIQRLRKALGIT